jgi:hypothetical protein
MSVLRFVYSKGKNFSHYFKSVVLHNPLHTENHLCRAKKKRGTSVRKTYLLGTEYDALHGQ